MIYKESRSWYVVELFAIFEGDRQLCLLIVEKEWWMRVCVVLSGENSFLYLLNWIWIE